MSKTYAIGDLHGRYDLLCEALAIIEAHAGEDGGRLVCLGDFIDRGPDSRAIVERLMAGPNLPNWSWFVLQGNHEDIMLQALEQPAAKLTWWIGNGGGQTLRSYGYEQGDKLLPSRIPVEQTEWIAALPVVYRDRHRLFVHAGVPFDTDPMRVRKQTLQWMLYRGDVASAAETYDDEPHVSGLHIVHGHHQSADHPLLKDHRTNLDSFAWKTGRLAIGVFDDAVPGGPNEILWAVGEPA